MLCVFVRVVQSRTAPTVDFLAKKINNSNSNLTATNIHIYIHKHKTIITNHNSQVHIVINDLGLTYQSPEGVDTEDYYLSQKEDDGKCLYDTQSGPL